MDLGLGRFGLWTSSYEWQGNDVPRADIAAEIEDLGFTLWLGGMSERLDLAEELLSATARLRVATGILSIWTMAAEDAAAAFTRIDRLAPGRFVLGLGVSHDPLVSRSGARYAHPYRRMVEYLDALDGAKEPVPVGRRVLAALGPRMLALSAARAAGAHPYLVTPEHTAGARTILGPDAFLGPEQKVVLETDPAIARKIGRERLATYLTLPNYLRNLERLGFTNDDFADGGSDHLVDSLVAWGDVDRVVARLQEHFDAGADHVAIQALGAGPGLPRHEWRVLAEALRK